MSDGPVRSLSAPACPPCQWRVAAVDLGPDGPAAAQLSWVLACQNAADRTDRPGEPAASPAELRGLLAAPYRGRRLLFAAVDASGGLAGWARLGLYEAFHRDLAHAAITVHPSARRCGVGSLLLDAVAEASRSRRRSALVLDAARTRASEAFAKRHGLYVSSRDLRSRLDLVGHELPRRLALAANAPIVPRQGRRHARPTPGDGYAALQWKGPCPEEFLAPYVATLDHLHASPSAASPAAPAPVGSPALAPSTAPFTAEEVRHREQAAVRAGLREYTACLIDRSSGRIAAVSSAHTADGLRGEQNETVVVPAYRGQGLAVRVKAQLIRELVAAEPTLSMLDTYNAVDNHRMLAVNRRLGFRPLDTHAAWTMAL
jgi:GNAT superfamily N-acetyltransferase